jgi:hypothetical protein
VRSLAYDIGPRIGIEGEKEFRNAISQINMNIKTLGTEMQAVASQFDKNDRSTEALTAKNEVLNKQIEEQKKKLSELQKGLSAAAEKYGENDKVTQGWKQAINKATADLNNMERELKSNIESLDDAADKTRKFNIDLGKLSGTLGKLGGTIAKAAITGIAAVGAAAAGAAVGAFKMASDVGKAADELITLSNKTGISTKQLQEMSYASRFVDVDLETMTGSMVKLTRSMDAARNGTKLSEEAFKKLGIEYKSQDGSLRDSKQVWQETIDALGKVANETERDAIALQLFGKSAQELNPLIKAGADELARLGEEANKVGAVLSDEALASAGKFDDLMQTFEASAKGLASTIGVAVIPAVTEVVNSVVGVVPKITEAIKTGNWEDAGKAVSNGINGLLEKITGALPGLASLAANIIGGLANSLVTTIPQVLPPLIQTTIQLLQVLIQTLTDNGPMLIQAGLSAIMMLIDGIVEALPSLIDATIKIIMALANGIIDNLPRLMDAAVNIVLALVDGILKLLPELIPAAIKAIVVFAQGLINALPKLIEKIPEIVQTIVNVIVENLPMLIDAAIEILVALISAIVTNLPLLYDASFKIMGAIVTGLIKALFELNTIGPKLLTKLKDEFGKINWGQLGKDIITGIANGIKNAASSVVNALRDSAKKALEDAKKFLGIQSPSKVMRDQVGMMIGAGIAEGITDSAKRVNAAMQGLNKQMVTDASINSAIKNMGRGDKESSTDYGSAQEITITTPIMLDGQVVAKSTSRVQLQYNKGSVRSLGVVPA